MTEALIKCPQLKLVHVPVYSVETAQKESLDGDGGDIVVARPRYHDEMPSFRPDGTRLPPNPPAPGTNKACLEPYRQASMSIFRLLKDWCTLDAPGSVLEKGGLDEAFIDITEAVEEQLIDEFAEKYTILRDDLADEAITEENIDDYDIQFISACMKWDGLGECVSVDDTSRQTTSPPLGMIQMKLGELRIWKGCQLARELRSRLRNELRYIASIGVAPNKMLAKLISALHKPDKQTRILPGQITPFMHTVPFEKIRLMGGKMGQRVLERPDEDELDEAADLDENADAAQFGTDSVMASDLWPLSVAELGERVGDKQTAAWIYNLIRGRDDSPCTPRSLTKSFMSAKAFRPVIKEWPELHDWCVVLCGELWSRLQEERELSNRWPTTLSIQYRSFNNNKFQQFTGKRQWANSGALSKSCEFPKSSQPDPLVVKFDDVLNTTFRLLKTVDVLFPMGFLSVSVYNFKPLDAQGRAKLTRVDQFFAPSASNDSIELPPSKASLFEDQDRKKVDTSVAKKAKAMDAKKTTSSVLELLQAKARTTPSRQPEETTVSECNTTAATNDHHQSSHKAAPNNKKPLKGRPNANTKGKIGCFFQYKCPKCKFTCDKENARGIQEHTDYHLALELSRS